MVDTPDRDFLLSAELLVLDNIVDVDEERMSPEMQGKFWALFQQRSILGEALNPPINSNLVSGNWDGNSDEADDGNADNVTVPPRNGSPNPPSYTEAGDNTQDTLEPISSQDQTKHKSLSSKKTKLGKTDQTARKPNMLDLGVQPRIFEKKYVPSPLSQPPMVADARESEPVCPKTPVKSILPQNISSDKGIQIRQHGQGLSDVDATSRPENSHNGLGEQRRIPSKSHPEIAEIEEINTSVDFIEGNAISYTVPFRDQMPPRAQSYGKCASKFVKGLIGKGNNEGTSAGDEPLPPSNGELPEEPKQTSDAPTKSRKRRTSSSSSQASKRSRSSSDSVKVSGRRLPLLFTLATSSSSAEHRHAVIPLPISWSKFQRMAVEAFARESSGQEIPTVVSDQAKYVMKWNKPATLAHGDTFPESTELCRENINAVLQWMLYSGAYDFCEIYDTQTAESIVKDEASPVSSENRPLEQKVDGNLLATVTTALGCKGNTETASNVPNSARESEDRSQEDVEPVSNGAMSAAGRCSAERIRKLERNVRDNADAEERESIGIQDNSMTETGVNVDRKGG